LHSPYAMHKLSLTLWYWKSCRNRCAATVVLLRLRLHFFAQKRCDRVMRQKLNSPRLPCRLLSFQPAKSQVLLQQPCQPTRRLLQSADCDRFSPVSPLGFVTVFWPHCCTKVLPCRTCQVQLSFAHTVELLQVCIPFSLDRAASMLVNKLSWPAG